MTRSVYRMISSLPRSLAIRFIASSKDFPNFMEFAATRTSAFSAPRSVFESSMTDLIGSSPPRIISESLKRNSV